MEVILIDDVFELGRRGQVVQVADGYGRNYLIPRKLAIPSTSGNRKMIEQQRLVLARKEVKDQEAAQLLAGELEQLHLMISRKSGDSGALFGSVTAKDLGDLLEANGVHVDRRRILLPQPIKTIGNFTVEARPHSDVSARLTVSVLPESDQPVFRVKKKDPESDRIVAELEVKVREISQLSGAGRGETAPEAPAESPKSAKPKKASTPAAQSEPAEAAEE